MPVTDDQVATLRVLLAGHRDEHRRLLHQLDRTEANVGYSALLASGFFEAVERRFIVDGKTADNTEVINFVASIRERSDEAPDILKPDVAERMILHALDKGASIADLDADTVVQHQLILLAALVGEARLNESELNAFMNKIRADADELLE